MPSKPIRGSLLLCLAFIFSGVSLAQRPSLAPPGDCTAAQHGKLQNDVNRFCKKKPSACKSMMSCDDLDKNWRQAEKCANARQRINKKCFRGGDKKHKQAEAMYRRAASKCRKIYKKKCE